MLMIFLLVKKSVHVEGQSREAATVQPETEDPVKEDEGFEKLRPCHRYQPASHPPHPCRSHPLCHLGLPGQVLSTSLPMMIMIMMIMLMMIMLMMMIIMMMMIMMMILKM